MSSDEITVEAMREHIADGSALALLDSTAPPVRREQGWWAVTQGSTTYQRVTDSGHVSKLDALLARKQASQRRQAGQV